MVREGVNDVNSLYRHLSDVTLEVEEEVYFGHRAILSSRSDYFRILFSGSWKESNQKEIKINEIYPESFEVLMNFLYSDEIDEEINPLNALEHLKLGQFYGIEGLTFRVERKISEMFLNYDNVCQLWNAIQNEDAEDLCEECREFLVENFSKCSLSKGFLDLDIKLFQITLQGDIQEDDNFVIDRIRVYSEHNAKKKGISQEEIFRQLLPPHTFLNRRLKSVMLRIAPLGQSL